MTIPDVEAKRLFKDLIRAADEWYDVKDIPHSLQYAPYAHGAAVGMLMKYLPEDLRKEAFKEIRDEKRNEKRRKLKPPLAP